jgi:hypothetical protein
VSESSITVQSSRITVAGERGCEFFSLSTEN